MRGNKSDSTPQGRFDLALPAREIIRLLKERGEWENTLLVFSSDNGVHRVGGHDPDFFDSNGPFRGCKRDLYEGGVRTPFLVSWPRHIRTRRETLHVAAFWDFLPTVCDVVGAEVPDGVDGLSYLPVLQGEEGRQPAHEVRTMTQGFTWVCARMQIGI